MEVEAMKFCNKSYFLAIILTLGVIAGGLGFSTLLVKNPEKVDERQLFLQRHALPSVSKQQFKSFFKSHKLDSSVFTLTEKELEQRLSQLGFQRTANGSNSLVMRCPKELGNFIVKVPGRFHEVTRAVVDKPLENISRAQGADRINEYAAEFGVKSVKAVDEYLFHIPGSSKELSDYHYLVVEPYLDLDEKKSFDDFSLQQFKETVDIICATRYSDTHSDNIVLDKQGVVYFLDTSQRDYLSQYKNLPSELYFSSSSESETDIQSSSTVSTEEQLIDSMKETNDVVQQLAAQKASECLDVIYHGLMPITQEKIDVAKQTYLRKKVNTLIKEVETLVEPFKNNSALQSTELVAESGSKNLYETIQATFEQRYLQAA